MSEVVVPAVLATMDRDLIKWVLDQIVDRSLHPIRDEAWAGQEKLISDIARQFTIEPAQAREVLKYSIEQLWREKADGSPDAERRLMIMRLEKISGMLMKELTQPKRTRNYTLTPKLDGTGKRLVDSQGKKKYDRDLKSETITKRIDPSLVKLLLDVEMMRIKLLNLDKTSTGEDLTKRMVGELERMAAVRNQEIGVSLLDATKNVNMNSLPAPVRKVISHAIEDEKKATSVTSAPTDGGTANQ